MSQSEVINRTNSDLVENKFSETSQIVNGNNITTITTTGNHNNSGNRENVAVIEIEEEEGKYSNFLIKLR